MINQLPFLLALLSAALFGLSTPASKLLLEPLSPFQLAGMLYLGAAIGVVPWLIKTRVLFFPWQLSRRNRLYLLGAIANGGILGPVFLLLGLKLASAASASLWLNLELVATAILGYCLFKDHLGRIGWLGVGGCFLAASLLSWGEGSAGIRAGLLVALGCICWGFDNHLTALIDGIPPAQSTFWKGIVAGCINLTIGMVLTPLTATPTVIGWSLVVGILAYGLSIVLYITSAQDLGATRSQLIFACAPFFGVVFSAIALQEQITFI
ncbi:conserved membrane hypothetical protein [Hyella patelloides LEGE 07179]|uniref:EamA domain-containing protein n=1 Tax=Hyella patelloides LEGE 07179 TaxID=945734 RepID=A0A563W1M0_9CYAN|nr:DMT family transporter [Hyella patelloides]VEP17556.1 conserved membrane hypothetical protein [Hyella patelloides LEGE 07179]